MILSRTFFSRQFMWEIIRIITVAVASLLFYMQLIPLLIKENIFVGVGVVHVIGITLVLMGILGPIQAAIIHLVPDTLVFINSIKLLRVKIDD